MLCHILSDLRRECTKSSDYSNDDRHQARLHCSFVGVIRNTRNTFCGTRYLSHCSCISAFDAFVDLQLP